ncbi:hypothetical protein Dtpsy_2127 [[Acidovorax] ebreus TPSY]|jgi:hypothetical protein|uniref:Uncharacterized protein n=2 Tax=Comamonadaceae TaxID=80864 RepID=A0A9J9UB26_ACIET|nr:hypothetical protein Dtpsy_2127 [[Acidovorax] ebreus TPSY]
MPAANGHAMPIHYTVLQLLNAAHGSLAEIELVHPDLSEGSATRWLWIESTTVMSLQIVCSGGNPSKRIFDHAVLMLDGLHGELAWPSGRREALSLDPGRALRPEFQRLVHQHLN